MTEREDKEDKKQKGGKKAERPSKPAAAKGSGAKARKVSRKATPQAPAAEPEPVPAADPARMQESEPPSSGLFPPMPTDDPVISNIPEDLEMTVNLSGDLFRLPGRDDLEGPTQTFLPDDMSRALDRIRAARENGSAAQTLDASGADAEDEGDLSVQGDDEQDGGVVDDAAETVALSGRDVAGRDMAGRDVADRAVARAHLKGLLEAIVFVADAPMKTGEIARAASAPVQEVRPLLGELRAEYSLRGVHLDEVAGGWLFRTAAVYAPFVRDVTGKKPVRLSRAQVETLAIVAYRQPITRPEVDEIRGVDCGPVLKLLLERDLVRILGKKDEPGRPILYGTTAEFLELFGLKSLKDLPTLKEFTDLSDDSRRVYEDETGEGVEDAYLRREAEGEAGEPAPGEPPAVTDDAAAHDDAVKPAPGGEETTDDDAVKPAPGGEETTDDDAVKPAPGGEETTDDDEFPEDYDDDDFEDDDDDDDADDDDDDAEEKEEDSGY